MTSDLWRRLAKVAVRLYPAAWRERYEDEVEALLEKTAPGPGVVLDLGLGAIRERSSALGVLVWFVAVLVRALVLTLLTIGVLAVVSMVILGSIVSARHGADWLFWLPPRIFDVMYAATAGMTMWFFFSVQFSLPVLVLLLWPPIRRRHPVIARVIFTAAFCGFSIWLGHLNQQAAMLLCGWLIAVKVFPTAPAAPTDLGGSIRRIVGLFVAIASACVQATLIIWAAWLAFFVLVWPVLRALSDQPWAPRIWSFSLPWPGFPVNLLAICFALLMSAPVLLLTLPTRISARFPWTSRLLFLSAFLVIPVAFLDLDQKLVMPLVGWLLARRLFPTVAASAPPPRAIAVTTPARDAATSSILGLRRSTVTS
jgi:hypothetical protein